MIKDSYSLGITLRKHKYENEKFNFISCITNIIGWSR